MVKVYRFRKYDILAGENKTPPMRGTCEAIERIKGNIIEDSAEEIDSALLDGNGFVQDTLTQ
jgi:hypothetical protein